MRIAELFAREDRPIFSFEFFPPKTDKGFDGLRGEIRELKLLNPDYVSVTWGAGGSTRSKTVGLTIEIQREIGLRAMAHLSCIGSTPEQLSATLDELATMRERLTAAGALIGASDHHCNKSLYCRDPDGLEFEVMWLTPASEWGDDESAAIVRPLDLEGDLARYGGSTTTFGHRADDRGETG